MEDGLLKVFSEGFIFSATNVTIEQYMYDKIYSKRHLDTDTDIDEQMYVLLDGGDGMSTESKRRRRPPTKSDDYLFY